MKYFSFIDKSDENIVNYLFEYYQSKEHSSSSLQDIFYECYDIISYIFSPDDCLVYQHTSIDSHYETSAANNSYFSNLLYSDIITNVFIYHIWNTTPYCSTEVFLKKSNMNRSYFSKTMNRENFWQSHPYSHILELNGTDSNKKLKGFRPCFLDFQYALIKTRKDSLLTFHDNAADDATVVSADDFADDGTDDFADVFATDDATDDFADDFADVFATDDATDDFADDDATDNADDNVDNKTLEIKINVKFTDKPSPLEYTYISSPDSDYESLNNLIIRNLLSTKELHRIITKYCTYLEKNTDLFNNDSIDSEKLALAFLSERLFALKAITNISTNPDLNKIVCNLIQIAELINDVFKSTKNTSFNFFKDLFSSYESYHFQYDELITTLSMIINSRLIFSSEILIKDIISLYLNKKATKDSTYTFQKHLKVVTRVIIPFTCSLFHSVLIHTYNNDTNKITSILENEIKNNNHIKNSIYSIINTYHSDSRKSCYKNFKPSNELIFKDLYQNIVYEKDEVFNLQSTTDSELKIHGLKHYLTSKYS